jgi:hypothetical protein
LNEAGDENKQPDVEHHNNGHLEESKVDRTETDRKQVKQEVTEGQGVQSLENKNASVVPESTGNDAVGSDSHCQDKPITPSGTKDHEMQDDPQETQSIRKPLSGLKRTAHMMSALFGGDIAKRKIRQKLEKEYEEIKDYIHRNDLSVYPQRQRMVDSNSERSNVEASHPVVDQTENKEDEPIPTVDSLIPDQLAQPKQDQVINQD